MAGRESAVVPLSFAPGIVKDKTRSANKLGWWDANNMRFVNGLPQTIGGWIRPWTSVLLGVARNLFSWSNLSGQQLMFIGTNSKAYADTGGATADITPIRASGALANNSITSVIGSGIVTITSATHGANIGDYVTISGATAFNSLTAPQLNQEFSILTVPTANTYTVNTGGTASASGAGGGAGINAAYQISSGSSSAVYGSGWGASTWGRSTWSSAASTIALSSQLRTWTCDNWGEDLIFNPRGGQIYHYDTSSPARGVEISTIGGASDTPVIADQIMVNGDSRQVLAFATNEIGSAAADPLLVRFSDIENYLDWTPTEINSAGELRLSLGSRFLAAVRTRQEILVFTDTALYSLQFTSSSDGGGDFRKTLISPNISLIGPKAVTVIGDLVFWQGLRGFYVYNGQVQEVPCQVKEFVFRNINIGQKWKCHAGANSLYGEIWFFYPSVASDEIDSYVIFNINDQTFTTGNMCRTAWIDNGVFSLPRACDANSYVYDHESGAFDGSTSPESAINHFIESSPVVIGDSKRAAFVRSFYPDLTFLDSTSSMPTVTMTMRFQNRSGTALFSQGTQSGNVDYSTTSIVEEYTEKIDLGARGRLFAFRMESNEVGVQWRVGSPELEITSDGRR